MINLRVCFLYFWREFTLIGPPMKHHAFKTHKNACYLVRRDSRHYSPHLEIRTEFRSTTFSRIGQLVEYFLSIRTTLLIENKVLDPVQSSHVLWELDSVSFFLRSRTVIPLFRPQLRKEKTYFLMLLSRSTRRTTCQMRSCRRRQGTTQKIREREGSLFPPVVWTHRVSLYEDRYDPSLSTLSLCTKSK